MNSDAELDGANGDGDPDADVQIEFGEYFGGTEQDEIKSLVQEFNETHDDIHVSMSNIPFDEFFDAIFTGVASGEAPHVASYWMSTLRFMESEGAIRPVDDWAELGPDDYYESVQSAMTLDEELYSFPMDIHGNMLISNDTVLEEAGVDEIPEDFESFREACDAIQENTDGRSFAAMEGGASILGMRTFHTALVQEGGQLVEGGPGDYEVVYDGSEGQAAIDFLDNVTGEYGWDEPEVDDPDERFNLFLEDELGFMLAGNWHVNTFQDEDGEVPEDLEYTFSKPYVFPGGEPATFAESTGFIFPADDSHTDEEIAAAVEFAEWITTNNPLWAQTAAHLPASPEVAESEEVTSAKYYDELGIVPTVKEMAEAGEMRYLPRIPSDPYETAVSGPLVDAYAQNTDPQEALEASADALRDRLS
ncbi:extracellular solute-binding protein [Natronococcus pandeyae]|nr:extracellular solute-binding protein [Natronococcus pandeyae]